MWFEYKRQRSKEKRGFGYTYLCKQGHVREIIEGKLILDQEWYKQKDPYYGLKGLERHKTIEYDKEMKRIRSTSIFGIF